MPTRRCAPGCADLLDPKIFRQKLDLAREKNALSGQGLQPPADVGRRHLRALPRARALARADDRRHRVHRARGARDRSARAVREQATFLDLDHGTYPYVTSSNPVAGEVRRRGRGPARCRPGARHREGVHHGRCGAVPERARRRRSPARPHRGAQASTDEHQAPPAGRLARRGDDATRCGSTAAASWP